VRRVAAAFVVAMSLTLASSAQAQTITANCDTPPSQRDGCNRWYTTASVSLWWQPEPPGGSIVSGCTSGALSTEGRFERSCKVDWAGGTSITKTVWIGIDRTPPQLIGLQPDRPPDHNGWYNHPVGLTFQAADATSGLASCSATSYGGPDGAGIPIGGSCRDVAGNTGLGAFPLDYDATPPAAPRVEALARNRRVALSWSSTPDAVTQVVRIGRSGRPTLVFFGAGGKFTDRKLRNGRRYSYVVTLIDQAGNQATGQARAVPTDSPLFSPVRGARLRAAPLLVWKPLRRARYYNVQLVRNGNKILSRWPRVAKLQLHRNWRYAGRRHRLARGRYCWRVWPGFGKRSQRRYGKLLGTSCFRIVR
jgi:hypothetical protein